MGERFHNLMESVYTPDLFANQPAGSETLTRAQRSMQALQNFKNTPQYQSFRQVTQHTLAELDAIANSTRTPHQRNTNFQNLGDGLWQAVNPNTTSRFGVFQADLYQQACPDANRLVRMHAFAQQKPNQVAVGAQANARACIKELSERLDICGPGLVQHFDEAVNTVRQASFTPSLPERFEALRIQISRDAITEFVRNRPDPLIHGVGNEIHRVAAWQNHYSRPMHLPFIQDVYASPGYTEDFLEQIELACKLASLQTWSVVSKVMATQILEEAHDLWNQAQADGATDLTRHCMPLIEKIGNKYGAVDPHRIFELNDDGLPCRLHDNPTLLATSIIRQLKGNSAVHPCEEDFAEYPFVSQVQAGTLQIVSRVNLSWLETTPPPGTVGEPEQQLLSTKNLSREQIHEFWNTRFLTGDLSVFLKAAMHEMLHNDWGHSLPPLKTQAFDAQHSEDVFVHLAMGFAKGLRIEHLDDDADYFPMLGRALNQLVKSKVLEHYTGGEIFELLTCSDKLDKSLDSQEYWLDVARLTDRISRLETSNVDIELYEAALEFNWADHPDEAAAQVAYHPAFIAENSDYGICYVDILSIYEPDLLNTALCNNIGTIRHAKVAFELFQACSTHSFDKTARNTALKRLVQRNDDAFVSSVLRKLSKHGYSLRSLTNHSVINDLRRRHMPRSANVLTTENS